jgi:hypothetical protein
MSAKQNPGVGDTGAVLTIDDTSLKSATATANCRNVQDLTARSSAFTNFVLAQARCVRARASLAVNEIDFVGVALRGGFIGPNTAVAWLEETGVSLVVPSSLEAA